MSRSVVLRPTPRCPRCQLTPRWCVCAGLREMECPLRIDVLAHFMEDYRPSSTGHLIKRVLPASGRHIYRRDRLPPRAEVVQPGRELWILHPDGETFPTGAQPAKLQVLLLDGTWAQAAGMAREVGGWGRRVSLPMKGESRYWLRTQGWPGRFSTAEALLFLLAALGLEREHAHLREQFELHVFASLCSRGHKEQAAEYLRDSPAREAFPELIASLTKNRRDRG